MKFFTLDNTKPMFDLLEKCRGVKQMETHHPEGDVFVHSLQVLKWAFRETIDTDLILAAMLHDIGKIENSQGHEQIAVEWLKDECSVKTLWLIEHHMRIWYYILGDMRKLSKCKHLAEHPWLPELVQLARWDKMGRTASGKVNYDRETIIDKLNLCASKHFGKLKNE